MTDSDALWRGYVQKKANPIEGVEGFFLREDEGGRKHLQDLL